MRYKIAEVYRIKGVLRGDDGGKTWWVYRIDYVTQADTVVGDYVNDFSFVANDLKKAFETIVLERIVEEN